MSKMVSFIVIKPLLKKARSPKQRLDEGKSEKEPVYIFAEIADPYRIGAEESILSGFSFISILYFLPLSRDERER